MIKRIPYDELNYSVDELGNIYSKTGRKLKCSLNSIGYRQLFSYKNSKLYKSFLVHRLVWETFNGLVPDGYVIDHINRDKLDNRLSNLRIITQKQNLWNTDAKGCYKLGKKWRSVITADGKLIHIGTFNTEEEAHSAYLKAKEIYHAI